MSIPSFPPRPEDTLKSDSAGIPGATEIKNLVNISQASYDALAKKDSSTLYVVKGAGALVAGVASVNGQTGAVTVNAGVSSVNGQTGNVSLSFSSPGHTHTAGEVGLPSISVGALTSTVGASSSEYYEYGLAVNLPSAGAYDVRVVLVGASTSLSSGGALVAINGSSYVGSTPPAGYALYGGAELVGNTAQAMVASTTSALSSSFVYATSAAASLAVKLNTANPPDAAHLVPGSHIIAIRCGDGPS
jgi:hypothetical protein